MHASTHALTRGSSRKCHMKSDWPNPKPWTIPLAGFGIQSYLIWSRIPKHKHEHEKDGRTILPQLKHGTYHPTSAHRHAVPVCAARPCERRSAAANKTSARLQLAHSNGSWTPSRNIAGLTVQAGGKQKPLKPLLEEIPHQGSSCC